jgi:hypothetical protein
MKKNLEYFLYLILYSTCQLALSLKFLFFGLPFFCVKWCLNKTLSIEFVKSKKSSKIGFFDKPDFYSFENIFASNLISVNTFIWLFYLGDSIMISIEFDREIEYKTSFSKAIFIFALLISIIIYLKLNKKNRHANYFKYFYSKNKGTIYYIFIALLFHLTPILLVFLR